MRMATFGEIRCNDWTNNHCGVFFINLKMSSACADMFVAFFRIHIQENADIRLCDERAVKVHICDPINCAINALVGKGRIIIAVADNVRSFGKIFYNSVFRAYVMLNSVRGKHCRKFFAGSGVFSTKAVADHSAKPRCRGFGGVVDGSSFAAKIFRKEICLGCLSASVNAFYYNKKSAFVFQNKNAPFEVF